MVISGFLKDLCDCSDRSGEDQTQVQASVDVTEAAFAECL